MSELPSLLWLNNILLYVYTSFCLCIHLPVDTWVTSTFGLLWIMLLWTWACNSFWSPCFQFFWEYTYKWSCWIIWWFYFNFLNSILTPFSPEAALFYFPTSSAQRFQFLHILANTCYFLFLFFFLNNHTNGYEVISHCNFDLHFPNV